MRKQISCSFCPHKCTEFEQEANAKIPFELCSIALDLIYIWDSGTDEDKFQTKSTFPSRPFTSPPKEDSNRTRKNINQRELSLIAALIAPTFFLPSVYR